jgi:heme A synthase
MVSTFLVSTALMAVLIAVVLGWVARRRGWYHYSPATAIVPADDGGPGTGQRLSDDPRALAVAFAVLVVAAVLGVISFISGGPPMVGTAVGLAGGGLVAGYLLFGVYLMATERGHPRSLAVAESATVAGVLFLVAVTAQLLA